MKKTTSIVLASFLTTTLYGVVDKNASHIENMRQGGDFYKTSLDGSEKKEEDRDYLKLIYEENKKQTKIQKQILDILKRKLDPKPPIITKADGTKCVANSSPDCFDYASLIMNHPEVIKIPVLKDFLSDPYDLNKAAKYLQWQQGKLFPHAFDIGNALQMAQAQWGDKVNPLAMTRPSFNSATGLTSAKLIPEAKKKYLVNIKEKTTYNFFFGYNINLDILAVSNIAEVLLENPELKFNFYFNNDESKKIVEELFFDVYAKNLKAFNNAVKEVNKKKFEEFGVITTPSLAMTYEDKKNNKNIGQIIANGRIGESMFLSRVFNFMEFKKLIKSDEFSDSKLWKSKEGRKYTQEHFKQKFNVEVLKDENK